jgi:hypothetical protein
MLDWSRLKTYQNSKYKSFEELCNQLAKRLHGSRGRFTSIDDSGGGDGVEFYLTLANGDEWGWQAKFYLTLAKIPSACIFIAFHLAQLPQLGACANYFE